MEIHKEELMENWDKCKKGNKPNSIEPLIWVTDAKYIDGYNIWLSFNDGVEGVAELSKKINALPVFKPLKNVNVFKNFKLSSWTLEWEGDIDIAPKSLYELVLNQKDNQQAVNI